MRGEAVGGIVEAASDGVIVHVHVQPRAGTTQISGRHGDALKIRVAAPPVDGRATDAARIALAGAIGVSPAAVALVSGESSRRKRFRVRGLDFADAVARVRALVVPPEG